MNGPPATSDSPTGMSNGARFSSASAAMKKITAAIGCHTMYGTTSCCSTIVPRLYVPANIARAITLSTSGSS